MLLQLKKRQGADATFNTHIHKSAQLAKKVCGWILRTFSTRCCSGKHKSNQHLIIVSSGHLISLVKSECQKLWRIMSLDRSKVFCYWQQFSHLHMYSQQRHRERYPIIYVWKILEGLVPNCGITPKDDIRCGRLCIIPPVKPSAPAPMQTIRYSCFAIKGLQLFNMMPHHLKNMTGCSTLKFKNALNSLLANILNKPRLPGLHKFCREQTNSLDDVLVAYIEGLPRAEDLRNYEKL